MSGQMELADASDIVHSAASRMMWAQENRVWRLDSLGAMAGGAQGGVAGA